MMHVIYDISFLGFGHKVPRYRAGIFRVVETLAALLVDSKECQLSFCAPHYLQHAFEYLAANTQWKEVPLPYPTLRNLVNRTQYQVSARLGQARPPAQLPLRIARKLLRYPDQAFGPQTCAVDPKSLAAADIYHSPFHALPPQVKQARRVQRFLTIYDLIPIHYPEYFGNNKDHILHQVVKSLGPEDWVLCISQATKADLCSYLKIDPARVAVTYLAADPMLFYPCSDPSAIAHVRHKYGIPEGSYLLSVNTLEPRKNMVQVIRCFARILQEQRLPDLHLVLAGSKGWNYDEIFQEIAALDGVKERIIVTGRVEDADLAALYSGALVFVYPSFYEGFGLPPLEAMQCGIPIITSNTSSLPEVVGDAGIMVDPNDADALCQNLLDIIDRPALHASLAQRSLERAAQFSWSQFAKETIQAYAAALESRR